MQPVQPSNNKICPQCRKSVSQICDNDCGTFYCCNMEFYYNNDKIVYGHIEKCGDDSDVDIPDTDE